MSARLDHLFALVAKTPNDTFARYALGMELKSAGRFAEAQDHFAFVIEKNGDYHPVYAAAAETLVQLGRVDEARAVYGKGMEVCGRKGEAHAKDFLAKALAALPS